MKILFLLFVNFTIFGCAVKKIQDCPDEKIINKMPSIGNSLPNEYLIYKGERKEISEFDEEWLKKNCPNIKVQEVY